MEPFPEILLEGTLRKESRYLSRWRTRWFVLTRTSLCSYKRKGDTITTEKIDLVDCVAVIGAEHITGEETSFALKTWDRTFLLVAPTLKDKDRWQMMISKLMVQRAPFHED
mmetsp:Transcript_100197/g.139242  ORF Transcript_100197/g.139242 Transcript_100197/m.139242 type:complete len:111 (-) Transcript_100197:257-589(-)|eukprot:symbB.v1.2.004264.t1/scaffold222.1/size270942/6